MILCFDIGNTDIDVGVFHNDVLVKKFDIPYQKEQSCWTYLGSILKTLKAHDIKPEEVSGSILCSVVENSTQGVYEALEIAFSHKPVLFEYLNDLRDPGMDRTGFHASWFLAIKTS